MLIHKKEMYVMIHAYIMHQNQRNIVQKIVQIISSMKFKQIENIVYHNVQIIHISKNKLNNVYHNVIKHNI